MWRIGNCYLPTSVHIPLFKQSEIPPQIPGSHWVVFGSSGRCGRYFPMWEISSLSLCLNDSIFILYTKSVANTPHFTIIFAVFYFIQNHVDTRRKTLHLLLPLPPPTRPSPTHPFPKTLTHPPFAQGIITSIVLYLPTALPTHQDWVVNPRSIRLLWDKIKIIPHQSELPKTTQWDPEVWWGISLGGICTGAERKQLPIRHILQIFLQFFILYKILNRREIFFLSVQV